MADTDTNNYVVGRGKLYFNKFPDSQTLVGPGYRYFGNTPSLSTTQAATALDHYSSDYGMKFKDASVDLQNDLSGAFTCDNINLDNVALFFQGTVDEQSIADDNATRATGTVTFTTAGTADDTVTINGSEVTLVADSALGLEVDIGVSAASTAGNLTTLINNNPDVFAVTAHLVGAVITLTAIDPGPVGNAITLAKTSTAITLSGATLTGATDAGSETLPAVLLGGYYPLGVTLANPQGVRGVTVSAVTVGANAVVATGNWSVDENTGLFHVFSDPDDVNLVAGVDVEVTYSVAGGMRSRVIGSNDTCYGSLRFYSFNPQGRQKDYLWPFVKLSPDGDFNLKGDDWQTVGWKFDVLQAGQTAAGRVFVDERIA